MAAAEPTLSALLGYQQRALNPTNKIFSHLPLAQVRILEVTLLAQMPVL